mgnify:FL=1
MAADQENESTLRIFRHTLLLEKDSGGTNPAGFPDSFVRSVSHRYRHRTNGIIGEVASLAEHLEIIIKRIVELIF